MKGNPTTLNLFPIIICENAENLIDTHRKQQEATFEKSKTL